MALLLAAAPASAAYEVELEAPKVLRELLTQHLDLMRYREREDINADQLRFMVETASEQVGELAATEGYFSPVSTVKIDHSVEPPVVRINVDAGPRTSVVVVPDACSTSTPSTVEPVTCEPRQTTPSKA